MGRMLNTNLAPAPELSVLPQRRAGSAFVAPAAPETQVEATPDNPLRKFAFYSGMAMLLVRIAALPDTLYYIFHVNTYLLYVVGPPALLGAMVTGAIGRTMKQRCAWYWLAFSFWVIISVVFSTWPGGSVYGLQFYLKFSLPMMFIIAGLAANWQELRAIFYTMAFSGLINLVSARLFDKESNGRIDFEASSTIGNSNDLASHLMLVLPFILFVVLDRRRNPFLRNLLWLPIAYGIWVILGTASRGGMIALFAVLLFVVFRGSAKQRLAVLVMGGVLAVSAPIFLGASTVSRLASLFGKSNHEEAKESGESRQYLLKKSIEYTIRHPLFGVGMDQFSNFEGNESVTAGKVGNWHETHNAFTQVSSECGIPAAIMFVLAVVSAIAAVNRTYQKARREGFTEIANACFCYLVAMIGYMVTITFLSNAFRFYLPVLIGLAIVLTSVAQKEMAAHNRAAGPGYPAVPR
jgi:putative inorganic carbon (hco3(-)) transporter